MDMSCDERRSCFSRALYFLSVGGGGRFYGRLPLCVRVLHTSVCVLRMGTFEG